MFTGLFTLIRLGSIWSRIGAILSGACTALAGWITRNPVTALIVALCVALAASGWYIHHQRTELATTKAHDAQAQAALHTEQASNTRLTATIGQQNAAVAQLGKDSAKAVAAGNQADAAAMARSRQRTIAGASIAVPPPAPAQPDCRTPDDVMAQKDDL